MGGVMKKIVIGLCGKAGAGKTTAARILEEDRGFVRLPFAGPLKAMARAFGLSAAEMTLFKEIPLERLNWKTPRQFMQFLGTEFGRKLIGENVWVYAWSASLGESAVENFGDILVVADDVRFENEAVAIREEGGLVIEITRAGAGSASGAGHASEAGVVPDITIANDGSEEDLSRALMAALVRAGSNFP
jgi:hypothetical protein